MTTIKDIARISGYSIGTVSRVINNHPDVSAIAKKKIEKVIKDEKFEPNSNAKLLKQSAASAMPSLVYLSKRCKGICRKVGKMSPLSTWMNLKTKLKWQYVYVARRNQRALSSWVEIKSISVNHLRVLKCHVYYVQKAQQGWSLVISPVSRQTIEKLHVQQRNT